MLFEHEGCTPAATFSGDVRVGPGGRVLFGAVLTAEDHQGNALGRHRADRQI